MYKYIPAAAGIMNANVTKLWRRPSAVERDGAPSPPPRAVIGSCWAAGNGSGVSRQGLGFQPQCCPGGTPRRFPRVPLLSLSLLAHVGWVTSPHTLKAGQGSSISSASGLWAGVFRVAFRLEHLSA